MSHILALDLGTTCGFAFAKLLEGPKPLGEITSGCRHLKSKISTKETYKNFYSFLGILFAHMQQIHTDGSYINPSITIIYEQVWGHTGTIAAQRYGGFEAIMLLWAAIKDIPVIGVAPTALKKFMTGSGNASKEMMVAGIRQYSGLNVTDHNEADALALLYYYVENYPPEIS